LSTTSSPSSPSFPPFFPPFLEVLVALGFAAGASTFLSAS